MHFPGDDELESFPTVGDFAVGLSDTDDRHIEFVSANRGRLASFPAWERADRDLRHFTAADVPLGSMDDPFEDADEGWRIAIFEHRSFVYVLEAGDPNADDFPRCFRVPRDRYLQAWAALIDAWNPIKPLDEVDT
ncbi:MAG TPA: hypothetical protein VLV78_07260 [Thermoanaerobaculia bacterium]|nr:hypothetical protein [Thermoanaerobaculia bacterium]